MSKNTKWLFINPWDHMPDVVPIIKGKFLDVIKHFEYLGMQIDDKLQMNKHVETMYKKQGVNLVFCTKLGGLLDIKHQYFCIR